MKRSLKAGLLLTASGVSLLALTLGLFVSAGCGIPYHDGPNAGYATGPGIPRLIEETIFIWLWLVPIGFALLLNGMFWTAFGLWPGGKAAES